MATAHAEKAAAADPPTVVVALRGYRLTVPAWTGEPRVPALHGRGGRRQRCRAAAISLVRDETVDRRSEVGVIAVSTSRAAVASVAVATGGVYDAP